MINYIGRVFIKGNRNGGNPDASPRHWIFSHKYPKRYTLKYTIDLFNRKKNAAHDIVISEVCTQVFHYTVSPVSSLRTRMVLDPLISVSLVHSTGPGI